MMPDEVRPGDGEAGPGVAYEIAGTGALILSN
jgi:hypothetical protein